ncbi:MAG: tRNA preQ1(34) S-adenosylmethionine ribosyltransferase-isomerase QueA [Candidatus Saganbacteria bacterium]|nr:tRNA preQ1(34) S-adenosylmethionine ribosyltransferase-isomerase QueA [Candidatus Saganbacteria bacterium]
MASPSSKTPTSDFDYQVPEDLIAHEPAVKRENSRLMITDHRTQSTEHRIFSDIIDYLRPGDLLVLNDTKVIPAKIVGVKEQGSAKIDILLLKQIEPLVWEVLVKPGKRLKVGQRAIFQGLTGEIIDKKPEGIYVMRFSCKGDFIDILEKIGQVPLPPYIRAPDHSTFAKATVDKQRTSTPDLKERYQTVYAEKEGASAAPTAGLHFSKELLERIREKGVKTTKITLHTGLATFRPVFADYIEDHPMHSEYLEVSKEASKEILAAKAEGRRVVAVGTTVVRSLEAAEGKPFKGETTLFISPGYQFKVVDAMITNFHWPRSTLIMLVSAFAGRDFIMKAYQEAIEKKYRFYSFGDAMLIL